MRRLSTEIAKVVFFYYGRVTKAADSIKNEIGLKLLDCKKQPYKNDIFKISNLLLYPANSILGQLNVRVDKHFVLEGDEIRFHEPGAANTQCKTAQVIRLYPNGIIHLQFKDGRKYCSHQFLKGELENNICGINSSDNYKQHQHYMKHNSYVQEEKQQQEQRQMNIKQEQTVSVQLLIDATDGELQMLTHYGDALAELVTTRNNTGINNMKDDYDHDEQDIDMNPSSIQQRQQQQQKQKQKQKQNGRGQRRRPNSVKIQGKDYEADDEKSEKDKDKDKENNNKKKNGLRIDPKIERKVEICNIKAITGLTIFGGQMESFLELSKEREEDPSVGIKNSQKMMNRFLKDTKLRLKQRGCNDQVIEYVFDRLLPFIKGMKSAANGNELPSFKVLKRQKFDEQAANVVLTNVFKALNHTVPDKINNIRNNYQDIAMTQKMNVLQMDDDDNNNNNNNNGSINFNEDDANSLYRDIHKELKHVKSAQQALIDAQKSTEEDQRKRMATEPNLF